MKHKYLTSKDCTCEGRTGCYICDGGLAICKVCSLAEGSLTTDCPGINATNKADAVYNGHLDFKGGYWVNEPNPANRIALRIKHRQLLMQRRG